MRVNYAQADYESEGFSESVAQGVSAKFGAKIWHMLTVGYYSRPRESMFREIACNALDAARMAGATVADDGSPLPFHVSLPTQRAPSIIFRDYGPGMSHDFMLNRAMSIGDSTKDDDDEAIGGFGLGLKTPFIVTDQFAICVYRGDHKQTYIIDKHNGQGRVMTDPTMREPANGTGCEVIIPVHDGNFGAWREIAQSILSHFPPGSFTIDGADIKPTRYLYESAAYGVLTDANADAYCKLGPIAYPVDFRAVYGERFRNDDAVSDGFELRFNIGDLTPTPNREAIQFDERTCANIRARIAEMRADYEARTARVMDGVTTFWGAMVAFLDGARAAGAFFPLYPKAMDWQGWKIWGVTMPDATRSYQPRRMRGGGQAWEVKTGGLTWVPNRYAPDAHKRIRFLIDDVNGHRMGDRCKVANASIQGGASHFILTTQAMCDQWGVPADLIIKASAYPPPKKARTGSTLARAQRAYKWSRSKNKFQIDMEHPEDFDHAYYIPVTTAAPPNAAQWLAAVPWYQAQTVWGLSPSFIKAVVAAEGEAPTDIIADARARCHALAADSQFMHERAARLFMARLDDDIAWAALNIKSSDRLWARFVAYVKARTLQSFSFTDADFKSYSDLERNPLIWGDRSPPVTADYMDGAQRILNAIDSHRPIFAMLRARIARKRPEEAALIMRTLAITGKEESQ